MRRWGPFGSFTPWISLWGGASGCGEGYTFSPPETVRFVAVVSPSGASPLAPLQPLRTPPESELVVVGYTEEQVAPQVLDPQEPLRPALRCPSLGPPVWIERVPNRPSEPDASAPRLTANWVEDGCGDLDPREVSVRFDCRPGGCIWEVARAGPCAVTVTFRPECDLTPMTLGAAPLGSAPAQVACMDAGDAPCVPGRDHDFVCPVQDPGLGACRVKAELRRAPPFEVARHRWAPAVDAASWFTGADSFPSLSFVFAPQGGHDAVLTDEGLWVAVDSTSPNLTCLFEGSPEPQLLRLDPTGLELLESLQARTGCHRGLFEGPQDSLWTLLRSPGRTVRGSQLSLATGRSLQFGALEASFSAPDVLGIRAATPIRWQRVGDRVVTSILMPTDRESGRHAVAVVDLPSSTVTDSVSTVDETLQGPVTAVAVTGDGRVFGALDERGVCPLGTMDRLNGECPPLSEPRRILAGEGLFDLLFTDLWYDPDRDRLLAVGGGGGRQRAFLWIDPNEREPPRWIPLGGRDLFPLQVAPWPDGRHLLVAGYAIEPGASASSFRVVATVAWLDLQTLQFLPGTWNLGDGPITRLRADPQGVTAFLSHAGEVVRLTPRAEGSAD